MFLDSSLNFFDVVLVFGIKDEINISNIKDFFVVCTINLVLCDAVYIFY